MASKRDRQRKLERVRVERRIARQAQRTRRKRQIQAGVGASLALVLIVVGLTWLLGGFDPDPEEEAPTIAAGTCTWLLQDPAGGGGITDTDHPPTTGEVRTGTQSMTVETNLGQINVSIDLARVPCTAASLSFLGEKDFYANSRCHHLDLSAKMLQCGDKTGNGSGAPSYTFARENLPAEPIGADPSASPSPTPSPSGSASPSGAPPAIYYAKGTVVMANTDETTNAGQFSIIYGDGSTLPNDYSIVGTVTEGLSIVEEIAKDGARTPEGEPTDAGNPNKDLIIQRLYLGAEPSVSAPPESPSGSPPVESPTAAGTAAAIEGERS